MSEYLLELKGGVNHSRSKSADNVQLALRPGTVHALMGENGGKIDIDENVCSVSTRWMRNIYEWTEDPGRQSG